MQAIRQFRTFGRPTQVLLLNQLTINIGFYMFIPFLAGYLSDDIGLATWIVGLVLGLRTLSQQGLFLIGGSLADRVGYKSIIIIGCAMRTGGFLLFGFVDALPALLLASALSGFAGALFNPAVRAYLAHEAGERRVEAFALFNVFAEVGVLVGPVIGVALLAVDFRLVSLLAGGLFLLLTVLQARYLPNREGMEAQSTRPVLADWREALANRKFVLFALGMLGYFALYNQLYLGLALEVRRLTGDDGGVGMVFTLSAVLSILAQVRVTAYCKARWQPPRAIALGLLLMGLAFVPPLLSAWLLPLGQASTPVPLPGNWSAAIPGVFRELLTDAVILSPVLLSTAILALGVIVAQPFAMSMIPTLSAGRLVGTYFGVYYLASGLGGAFGNFASGLAFDLEHQVGLAGLPWLLLVLIGIASASSVAELDRRGMLAAAAPKEKVGW